MKAYIYLSIILLLVSVLLMGFRLFTVSIFLILLSVILILIFYKKLTSEIKRVALHIQDIVHKKAYDKFVLTRVDEFVSIKEELNNLTEETVPMIQNNKDIKKQVKGIIDTMSSPVIMLDYNGKVILYNKSAEAFIRSNCEGCFYFEILKSIEFIDVIGKCLNSDLNGQEIKIGKNIYEVKSFRNVQLTGQKLIFCVFNEITLSVEKDKFEREFISAVSHELKTPLSAISGAADILAEENISPDEREQFVKIIRSSSDRMNELIKKLLILTEIRSGKNLKKSRVNLKECVNQILNTELPFAEKKGVTIKAKLEDAWVLGDEFLLTEMIRNIVNNAVKYTDKGIVDITIKKDSFVSISIKDSGSGLNEEELTHIFEPFYRADTSRARKSGGTGLGLTIAKRIAVLHNGNITVISKTGEGAEFTIQLPLL